MSPGDVDSTFPLVLHLREITSVLSEQSSPHRNDVDATMWSLCSSVKPFGCLAVLSTGYVCVVVKDEYVRPYSTATIHALLTSVTSLQAVIKSQKQETEEKKQEGARLGGRLKANRQKNQFMELTFFN